MCKELSKAKHQDYRNFLCITGVKVPSHAALSRFRALLSISDDTINELSKPFLSQAGKMEVGMIHHAREYFVPKERNQELRRLAEQSIYDRKTILLRAA